MIRRIHLTITGPMQEGELDANRLWYVVRRSPVSSVTRDEDRSRDLPNKPSRIRQPMKPTRIDDASLGANPVNTSRNRLHRPYASNRGALAAARQATRAAESEIQ
jgi:hypothetical protein